MSSGTLCRGLVVSCGGRKRLKAISQLVEEALWAHFRSLPPKEAMVALVVTAMIPSAQKNRAGVMVDCLLIAEKSGTMKWAMTFFCVAGMLPPKTRGPIQGTFTQIRERHKSLQRCCNKNGYRANQHNQCQRPIDQENSTLAKPLLKKTSKSVQKLYTLAYLPCLSKILVKREKQELHTQLGLRR